MKEIQILESIYSLPATWDEMTKKQLLALAKITAHCNTTAEIQLKLLFECIDGQVIDSISPTIHVFKIGKEKHMLFTDELVALSSVFDYLFETNENGQASLAPKLTVNHFKKIRVGLCKLHGPSDRLDNVTYNQFVWLQTYHNIIDANTPEFIDELLNVIYRTKRGKQKVRNIQRIQPHVKTVLMWYYLGTLNFLSEKFENALGGGSADGEDMNVFDFQQRIINSLAEGDVTKKDQVRESLLYDALYTMDEAAKKMKEIEKQHAK